MTSTPARASACTMQPLPRVEIEFNQVVLPLLRALADAGVPCWLDSGTLLGICRDGRPPAWDKDFDLAIWNVDFERCLHTVLSLLEHPDFQYYKLVQKNLNGSPYALILAQGGTVPKRYRRIPVAFHIYERVDNLAISPQPHYLGALGRRYARFVLSQHYPSLLKIRGSGQRLGLAHFLPALCDSSTRRFLLCLISQKIAVLRRYSRFQRKLITRVSASYPLLPDSISCASAYLTCLLDPQQSRALAVVMREYAVTSNPLTIKTINRLCRLAEDQETSLWDLIGDPVLLSRAEYSQRQRQALHRFRAWFLGLIEQAKSLSGDCVSLLDYVFSVSSSLQSLDSSTAEPLRKRMRRLLSDVELPVGRGSTPTDLLAHVLKSEADVASRYRVYSKHLCEYKLPLMNYELFEWRIPFDCFDKLIPAPGFDPCVLIPQDIDHYLTLRYGNWRVPAENWIYVLQDGCIKPSDRTRSSEKS